MLHHIDSPPLQDRLLAEAARVLEPGGTFAGTDSVGGSLRFKLLHVGDTLDADRPRQLSGAADPRGPDRAVGRCHGPAECGSAPSGRGELRDRRILRRDGAAAPAVAPKVIDAARFVLAEDGPAGATLERIAAAAGVSRMTLHRQGVTKADIVRALAQRFEEEHKQAMWQALVADGHGGAATAAGAGAAMPAVGAEPGGARRAGRPDRRRDLPRAGPGRADPFGVRRPAAPAAARRG